ncbi:MAG: hypothetical protein M1827_005084 [Pycnora praestabilis]|nr:MAG: hypothetical protein M1827_005084 [Pycnora praestabilis]
MSGIPNHPPASACDAARLADRANRFSTQHQNNTSPTSLSANLTNHTGLQHSYVQSGLRLGVTSGSLPRSNATGLRIPRIHGLSPSYAHGLAPQFNVTDLVGSRSTQPASLAGREYQATNLPYTSQGRHLNAGRNIVYQYHDGRTPQVPHRQHLLPAGGRASNYDDLASAQVDVGLVANNARTQRNSLGNGMLDRTARIIQTPIPHTDHVEASPGISSPACQTSSNDMFPSTVHHAGYAEERQIRRISPDHRPANASYRRKEVAVQIVQEDPSRVLPCAPDPGQRMKKRADSEQKQLLAEIKNVGGACTHCSWLKKSCDAEEECWKCHEINEKASTGGSPRRAFCFRGIDQLWLWTSIPREVQKQVGWPAALQLAREITFQQSNELLRSLPQLGHDIPETDDIILFYLNSEPSKLSKTSCVAAKPSLLGTYLQAPPKFLLQQIEHFLSTHISGPELVSIPQDLDQDQCQLLKLAKSAFRTFKFISNVQHMTYHGDHRSLMTARAINSFFLEICARSLAKKSEKLVKEIRSMLRDRKKEQPATRYAVAIYYRIIAELPQLSTGSVLDIILEPLITRARVNFALLEELYRDFYDANEDLQEFTQRCIPTASELHVIHISHEFYAESGHSVVGDYQPFSKDFTIAMPKLLVRDGNYFQHLHFFKGSGAHTQTINQPMEAHIPDGVAAQHPAHGIYMPVMAESSAPLANLLGSHDPTMVPSSWNEGTTVMGTPNHLAEAPNDPDQLRLTVEDDKSQKHLMHTLVGGDNELKRTYSPTSSQSSCDTPSPKRKLFRNIWNTFIRNSPTPSPDFYNQ